MDLTTIIGAIVIILLSIGALALLFQWWRHKAMKAGD